MTLFRAPVVSEFQKTKVTSVQRRWQLFKIATWAVTGLAGFIMVVGNDYRGDSKGDHALRPIQHGYKTLREAIITGEWDRVSMTPPPPIPRAKQEHPLAQTIPVSGKDAMR